MVSAQAAARSTTRTAESQGVVQDYLDVLLRNVLPDDMAEPETQADTAHEKEPEAQTAWPDDLASAGATTLAAVPVMQQAMVAEADKAPDAPVPDIRPPIIVPEPVEAAATMPALEQAREQKLWAAKPFASLLFDVMGLKLAAPLHELGGIMPLADKLQPMAAQADWFMGLIRWNGRTIRVVDTARFVMPERVDADQQIDYQSVILLGDSHWALAVNDADQSVHLQPADVRWRKSLGKRPWLAGTVLDRLCALLDVDVLVAMLDASDTARQVKADLAKES